MKSWCKALAAMAIASFILGFSQGGARADDNATLDSNVMTTLKQCKNISPSCASATKSAVGILVFPSVVKADLIVGGAGGKGALIEGGKITSYYSIGAASAGLQAGIETASQVYVFHSRDALNKLKTGPDWKVGGTADVAVATADANARAESDKDVMAYVFDAKGLHAGVALDVFDVWKTDQSRPSR